MPSLTVGSNSVGLGQPSNYQIAVKGTVDDTSGLNDADSIVKSDVLGIQTVRGFSSSSADSFTYTGDVVSIQGALDELYFEIDGSEIDPSSINNDPSVGGYGGVAKKVKLYNQEDGGTSYNFVIDGAVVDPSGLDSRDTVAIDDRTGYHIVSGSVSSGTDRFVYRGNIVNYSEQGVKLGFNRNGSRVSQGNIVEADPTDPGDGRPPRDPGAGPSGIDEIVQMAKDNPLIAIGAAAGGAVALGQLMGED